MKYTEFEDIISADRMRKYLVACNNDTRRAMTLYRHNLKLSQEMFTMISCFEVTLRNRIDKEMRQHWGTDWLHDFIMPGGPFSSDGRVDGTRKIIKKAYDELIRTNSYSHSKLLSQMEFGIWKYMFNNVQYRLGGRYLLNIFPNKPRSTAQNRVDNSRIFLELDYINNVRNRIAHHEPICFGNPVCIDTNYALTNYARMMKLFQWMGIDANRLMYGLDHVGEECGKIMCL
ncbi:MAG: Abi family protein [Bacteroidaceae bacterium]|nr:Abi family protein [Bacteroidaceae bacterium]